MRTTLIIMAELAIAILAGCGTPNAGGSVLVVSPRLAPQPDPISTDILAPAPTPHATCRCKTCDCTPACVGACSIPQPAEDAPAPIANSTPAASAAPATSGSASSCPGGQCSIRSAPVRRGLFGWRR